MTENLEQRLCKRKDTHQSRDDDIKYFKCQRCDGYGNYIIVGNKMICKDYGCAKWKE